MLVFVTSTMVKTMLALHGTICLLGLVVYEYMMINPNFLDEYIRPSFPLKAIVYFPINSATHGLHYALV